MLVYPPCSGAGMRWATLGKGQNAVVGCPKCQRSMRDIGSTHQGRPIPAHSSVPFS